MMTIITPNYYVTPATRGGRGFILALHHVDITDDIKNTSAVIDQCNCVTDFIKIRDAIKILAGLTDTDASDESTNVSVYVDTTAINYLSLCKTGNTISATFLIDEDVDELGTKDDGYVHYYYIKDILQQSLCKDYDALIALFDTIIELMK